MAFNADTYYANKYANSAWKHLKDARALRDRITAGTAYDWEIDRLPMFVKLAMIDMRLSVSSRNIAKIKRKAV